MKKSKSAPSLTALAATKPPMPAPAPSGGMKRNSVSCNVLSSLRDLPSPVISTQLAPVIEHNAVFISKVPITQVYQCMNKTPELRAEPDDDLATCMATPHDPIDERENRMELRGIRNNIDITMTRYQMWWERVKRAKKADEDK